MLAVIWPPPCIYAEILPSISIAVVKGGIVLVMNKHHPVMDPRCAQGNIGLKCYLKNQQFDCDRSTYFLPLHPISLLMALEHCR